MRKLKKKTKTILLKHRIFLKKQNEQTNNLISRTTKSSYLFTYILKGIQENNLGFGIWGRISRFNFVFTNRKSKTLTSKHKRFRVYYN